MDGSWGVRRRGKRLSSEVVEWSSLYRIELAHHGRPSVVNVTRHSPIMTACIGSPLPHVLIAAVPNAEDHVGVGAVGYCFADKIILGLVVERLRCR